MGAQLFDRVLDLTVAPLSGGSGLQVKDLRVTFNVVKTSTSEPNTAEIEIYNLSSANRGLIEQKNQAVVLKAGYRDLSGTIVIGHLRRVEHRKEGSDVISKLEVKDGGKDLYEVEFRRSYTKGTSRMSVVRDIIGTMSTVSLGTVAATRLQGNLPSKLALSGLARVCMDKVCRAWGVEWSVQDGVAQFLDPTGTRGGGTLAIKLTTTSGLIGSPAKTQRGCTFQSLLRPDMLPGSYVTLESVLVSGAFKVQKVTHAGDKMAPGAWLSNAEAVRL